MPEKKLERISSSSRSNASPAGSAMWMSVIEPVNSEGSGLISMIFAPASDARRGTSAAGIPSPSAYQGGCGADHLIGISGRLEAFHQVAAWCREGGEGQ